MRSLGCHGPAAAKLEGYALYEVSGSFPGVVPQPGEAVLVELWEAPETALASLDYYERTGSGLYRREEVEVEAGGGRRVRAFVYVWNGESQGRKVPLSEQPWRPPPK